MGAQIELLAHAFAHSDVPGHGAVFRLHACLHLGSRRHPARVSPGRAAACALVIRPPRCLVLTKMNCFKRLGEMVMATTFEGQVAELNVRASILNQFTALRTV